MPGDNKISNWSGIKELGKYERWMSKRKRKQISINTQRKHISNFFDWVTNNRSINSIENITWKDLDKYRDYQLSKGVKGNYVKTLMSSIISFYKMKYETTMSQKWLNVYERMKKVPKPVSISQGVDHWQHHSIDEIEKLIEAAKKISSKPKYTMNSESYTVLMFLLYTSQRAQVYDTTKAELKWDLNEIHFQSIKGRMDGKIEKMPFHPDLQKIIKTHLKNRPYESEYLFLRGANTGRKSQNCWKIINNIGKVAGIDTHPHRIRKTTGSYLRKQGVELKIIQKILLHKDFSVTTNLYTEVDMEDVKDAFFAQSFLKDNGSTKHIDPKKLDLATKILNLPPEKMKKLNAIMELI